MAEEGINVEALKDIPFGKRGYILKPELMADLKKAFAKPIMRSSDMSSDVMSEALDLCVSSIDKSNGNYELAARTVKEAMDKKFGPTWHCVIGGAFGFDCTYQHQNLLYAFYQGKIGILLYKC